MLSIKIGFFLAVRQIKRSSLWSTILIIIVMVLTFMNLVVTTGILVGLIEGAVSANRDRYTSDVLISKLREKNYIENSSQIIRTIETLPNVEAVTARYVEGATIETNYKNRTRQSDLPEEVATLISGIDPINEDDVTGLQDLILEGEYLGPRDFDQVILGYLLLSEYFPLDTPGFLTLDDVKVGSKIRLKIGDISREVTVKGILKSKVDEIDRRVFMIDRQLKSLIKRDDFNVDEIAVRLSDDSIELASSTKSALIANGFDKYAKVQTFEDAQPKFLQDIKDTFDLLGSIIGSISLVVAAITIFIVIFINAITRRKYIGIMKAIGITGESVEISYVFQSIFYAILGSLIGLVLIYFVLIPYVDANPINFPFSDGILVAPAFGTSVRLVLLVVVTVIAGYIPARIIVRKNTLDSILGRK
jgi:putative ABC transport system permease protein